MTRPDAGDDDVRHIAYLIDTMACDTAGTQKQLLETIRRLDRDRYDPLLICLWESPWMRTSVLPCETVVLGHRGFLKPGFPGVVKRLARILDERRIELVQVFFDEAIFVGWLGARFARQMPVLVSSRRDMGLGAAHQPWYHRLFPWVLAVANRDFAAIITNSEAVRQYAARRERTPRDKYVVVRNGVEFPQPGLNAVTQKRNPGVVGVGILASLTPVKRHDLLLRAWAEMLGSGSVGPCRLHIMGDGPERPRLLELAESLDLAGSVEFCGAVSDVAGWLKVLDIGVLCSDREGLSNAILEYMAHGLPVVATEVGGNGELVDSANGLLVPPGDVHALAEALRRLIGDEQMRQRMGLVSRDRALGEYSWPAAMSRLTGVYDVLLANRPAARTGSSS